MDTRKVLGIIITVWSFFYATSLSAQNPEYEDHRSFKEVDSLEHVLATNPLTGEELAIIYEKLIWGYTQIDGKKAMYYARKQIELASKEKYYRALAASYGHLAMLYYGASQYDSAHFYYEKALEHAAYMKTKKNVKGNPYTEEFIDDVYSRIYGNMGNLHNIQGKYHEAIEYYTKALKIFEKHGWKESQAIAYGNIGEMYLGMDNYEQAEINFTKLYAIGQEIGDSLIIMYADKELSALYLEQKNYDKALEHAEAARQYIFSHPEEGEDSKAFAFNLLAEIYLSGKNDTIQAENFVKQALQISDSTLITPREKAVSLRLLSSIHLHRGEWRKAGQTALDALAADSG
jgi:tetratricopeptide (TPR) repeat protein